MIIKLCMLRLYGWGEFSLWRRDVWQRDPDERMCCDGRYCGCYGATYREMWETMLKHRRT